MGRGKDGEKNYTGCVLFTWLALSLTAELEMIVWFYDFDIHTLYSCRFLILY